MYRSTKDTRNHPLWQPSLDSLRNVEQDEAGRLRAFRERFGRGWDLEGPESEKGEKETGLDGGGQVDHEESLMDLITGASGVGVGTGKEETAAGAKEDVEMVKVMKDGKLVKVPAQSRNERRK